MFLVFVFVNVLRLFFCVFKHTHTYNAFLFSLSMLAIELLLKIYTKRERGNRPQ